MHYRQLSMGAISLISGLNSGLDLGLWLLNLVFCEQWMAWLCLRTGLSEHFLFTNMISAIIWYWSLILFVLGTFKQVPHNVRGLSQKVVDLCYNTRLCIRNFLKCVWYFYIHFINILYKYGWNHSLNNKAMNVCFTVCQRVQSTSQIILLNFQRGMVKCFVYTSFI